MKLNNLNNRNNKPTSKKQPNQLKDMLSTIFSVINKFEKNETVEYTNNKDKIDILKNFVTDMIKDGEQKQIISGEKITEERPFVSKFKMI